MISMLVSYHKDIRVLYFNKISKNKRRDIYMHIIFISFLQYLLSLVACRLSTEINLTIAVYQR